MEGGGQAFSDGQAGRQTGKRKQKERETKRQDNRAVSLFIDLRVHE